MNTSPSVAVIVPAYLSFDTIERSLNSFLEQDYPAYEIIVIDSSPDDRVEEIVKRMDPRITYIHSGKRLMPHEARNVGVEETASDVLVFSDPDIYAPPNWLKNLVAIYGQYGGVINGSLINHTNSWLDWGIHMGKFDAFLPEARVHPIDFCATANMLCGRSDFEKTGGFEGKEMLGDLVISWRFAEQHVSMLLAPDAVVEHHHIQSYSGFLRERYLRGTDFARLRLTQYRWTRMQIAKHILATITGLRLVSVVVRGARHALNAKLFIKFLATLPVSLSGQIAWLLGETREYFRARYQ